jgi:hypothetical protein
MVEEQPGERIKHEQSKAYYYFCSYRDLGPFRSIQKVKEKLDEENPEKSRTIKDLEYYSSKYRWRERAQAYDDYLNKKQLEENEEAIKEMNNRQANEYKNLQSSVMRTIKMMQELPEDLNKAAYFLDACSRAYDRAAKGERLARGESTENIKNNPLVNVENTSVSTSSTTNNYDPPEGYLEALENYNELFGIVDEDNEELDEIESTIETNTPRDKNQNLVE